MSEEKHTRMMQLLKSTIAAPRFGIFRDGLSIKYLETKVAADELCKLLCEYHSSNYQYSVEELSE